MSRRSCIARLLSSAILITGFVTIILVNMTSRSQKPATPNMHHLHHVSHQNLAALMRSKEFMPIGFNVTNQSSSRNYSTSKQFSEFANYDFNNSIYSAIEETLYSLRRHLPHNLVILIGDQTKQRKRTKRRNKQSGDDFKAPTMNLIQNAKWKNTPKTFSTVPKKRSCAVIGNSGILLNSTCGSEIDSHEFVLRSNVAPIVGFEKDIGYRHDFVSLNLELSRIATSCLTNSSNPCFEEMLDRFKVYDQSIIWLSKLGSKKSKADYLGVISQLHKYNINPKIAYPFTSIGSRIARLWNITSPSSGLYLYTVAASVCDDISLYGFYPFYTLSDGTQLKHHYYENTSMDYSTLHRMPDEFKVFTVLNKFGFIRLVSDRCSQDNRGL